MKVALAFSGGVDSTVAALLLKNKSYQLTTVFIRFWARNEIEKEKILTDEKEAREIAEKLNLKFLTLDFSQKHKEKVVDYFIKSYQEGSSPNPCIKCNEQIKFGLFFDWAMENNFDLVASGHYAKIQKFGNNYFLKRGEDREKDQSYFLYQLTEEKIKKIIFPLGSLKKTEVRKIAAKNNLKVSNKKDSFDLCFLNETNTRKFIEKNIGKKQGNIIDQKGNIIGTHQGIWFYTIGQRKGLNIEHKKLKNTGINFKKEGVAAIFVIAKNKKKNELIVGNHEDCYQSKFKIKKPKIINSRFQKIIENGVSINLKIKVRSTGRLIQAKLQKIDKQYQIESSEKIFAIATGQSVVFYKNDIVLGGGIIS